MLIICLLTWLWLGTVWRYRAKIRGMRESHSRKVTYLITSHQAQINKWMEINLQLQRQLLNSSKKQLEALLTVEAQRANLEILDGMAKSSLEKEERLDRAVFMLGLKFGQDSDFVQELHAILDLHEV